MINHGDTEGTEVSKEKVEITLSQFEALVLFEWLASANFNSSKIRTDEAEQVVLCGLECQLEKALHGILSPDYDTLLITAKRRVLELGDDGPINGE